MKYPTRLSLRSFAGSRALAAVGSDSRVRVSTTRSSARGERRKKEEEEEQGEEEKSAYVRRKDGFRRFKTNEEIHFEALEHYSPDYEERGCFAGSAGGEKNPSTIQTHELVTEDIFDGSVDPKEEDNPRAEQKKAIANVSCNGSLSVNLEGKNMMAMNEDTTKGSINGSLDLPQGNENGVEVSEGMGEDEVTKERFDGTLESDQERKIRAELNRAIAIARRNSRQCERIFSDSRGMTRIKSCSDSSFSRCVCLFLSHSQATLSCTLLLFDCKRTLLSLQ